MTKAAYFFKGSLSAATKAVVPLPMGTWKLCMETEILLLCNQRVLFAEDEDTTEKLRSWTKEILVHHQTSTDAASNDDGDNGKYDTSRENGDSSAKVEEEPKCHEVAHNFGHSSNKESNSTMVKRESEVVVVAQA
ncbi:hypothetical protein ACSBR1_042648 [Camellia fascicularis]